jgi:hypothetical protein
VVLTVILLGTAKLVFETYLDENAPETTLTLVLSYLDDCFNYFFFFEALVKIIRNGFFINSTSYLRDTWSKLDFIIVLVSAIDMSLSGVKLPFLKVQNHRYPQVLRLLRILRPLRFISHNKSMKIVVNSLAESFGAIMNVMIVIGMVWVMFSILGMNLMRDQMKYCKADHLPGFNSLEVKLEQCIELGGTIENRHGNFDNLINSLITLYILSSLEGWPTMLDYSMNATEEGPQQNGGSSNGIFFLVFILVGTFCLIPGSLFLMNLFIGVIFVQFKEEQKKEKKARFSGVTDDQMRWILVQDLISSSKPNFDLLIRPKGKARNLFFKLVNSSWFETSIMFLILLNIVSMGVAFEGMSEEYERLLKYINMGFTGIFLLECGLKLIGLGLQYFKFTWNIFDFAIVISSKDT